MSKKMQFLISLLLILILTSCGKNDDVPTEPDPEQNPPQETIRVVDKELRLPSGKNIVLRGINYPTIDAGRIDNTENVHHQIDEAAKTGANAIRFPWYTNGKHFWDGDAGGPGTVDGWVANGSLKNMLEYSHQKGMIPILELHDARFITCANDWNYFNTTVANWWKSEAVKTIIEQTQGYLIINIANEFGHVRFTNDPNALEIFKSNYIQLVSELRAKGIKVPIMIDAPDCGTSSSELLSIAEEMQNADPAKNLIFSTHAYWFGYAPTQTAINPKLDEMSSKNVCFIIGEIANTQDIAGCGSQNILDIAKNVLEKACSNNIGWLAWTFNQDCSGPREMTPDGNFNHLTPWGELVVNNPQIGLKSVADCGAKNIED